MGCVLGWSAVSVGGQPLLQFTPWATAVVAPPSPVLGSDGRRHLVYEMTVANSAAKTTLLSVDVRDGRSGRVIDRISPSRSPNFMSSQASADPIRTLAPSEGGLLWFDVSLPRNARIPRTLTHTIAIRVSSPGLAPANPGQRSFAAQFSTAYGHSPATQAIFGYAAVQAVLHVLAQAGSSAGDRSAVVKDFTRLRYAGSVLGSFSIDKNGDSSFDSFVTERVKGGRLVAVAAAPG